LGPSPSPLPSARGVSRSHRPRDREPGGCSHPPSSPSDTLGGRAGGGDGSRAKRGGGVFVTPRPSPLESRVGNALPQSPPSPPSRRRRRPPGNPGCPGPHVVVIAKTLLDNRAPFLPGSHRAGGLQGDSPRALPLLSRESYGGGVAGFPRNASTLFPYEKLFIPEYQNI